LYLILYSNVPVLLILLLEKLIAKVVCAIIPNHFIVAS
jgi:hypothetical protein